jgi:hypothetical protein
MDASRTLDCAPFSITAADPLRVSYKKSGGWDPGEANEPFYRAFFEEPDLRLPAGLWEMTAEAKLVLPPACDGRAVELSASLTLRVE